MEQRKQQQQQEQNAPPSKPDGQLQFHADTGTDSVPWDSGSDREGQALNPRQGLVPDPESKGGGLGLDPCV